MLILPAEAEEALVSAVIDRISQALAQRGGEVGKVDRWGRRRLAYEIDRHGEGFYVVLEITAEPTSLKELDRILTLADEVLRFKVVLKPAA